MTRTFDSRIPQAPADPALLTRRNKWVQRVEELVEQIRQWSGEAGWPVEIGHEVIEERPYGQYEAAAARVQLPKGDLPERAVLITPVALNIKGREGRVDVEGYPTLSRVMLLGLDDGWEIMTASNIPLRLPWNGDTFRQLAQDLVA